jgi:O-antigen ligase
MEKENRTIFKMINSESKEFVRIFSIIISIIAPPIAENFEIIKMRYQEKITVYGLYLLAFFLPWQTRYFLRRGEISGGYSEYATISLYAIDAMVIILFIFFVYDKFFIKFNFFKHHRIFWLLIAGLELFIFISLFFASDKILALYHYGVSLIGVCLFWLLIEARFEKTKLLGFFLGGIFLQAALGIWQFFNQKMFAAKYLGIAWHNAGNLGDSVVMDAAGRWLRAYGGMDHPNILGGLLVIGLWLLVKNKDNFSLLKIFIKTSNKKTVKLLELAIFYFVFFIFITALFFSFSRTAWFALIVGFIFYFFFALFAKKMLRWKNIILPAAIMFLFLGYCFHGLVLARFDRSVYTENISLDERIIYLAQAKELINHHWLWGAGLGNYAVACSTAQFQNCRAGLPAWSYQPVHNVFLLVWAEIGIGGLLFFSGLFVYAFVKFWKNKKYEEFILFFTLIILMQFDHWLWSLHFGVIFFWFISGIALREELSSDDIIFRS